MDGNYRGHIDIDIVVKKISIWYRYWYLQISPSLQASSTWTSVAFDISQKSGNTQAHPSQNLKITSKNASKNSKITKIFVKYFFKIWQNWGLAANFHFRGLILSSHLLPLQRIHEMLNIIFCLNETFRIYLRAGDEFCYNFFLQLRGVCLEGLYLSFAAGIRKFRIFLALIAFVIRVEGRQNVVFFFNS